MPARALDEERVHAELDGLEKRVEALRAPGGMYLAAVAWRIFASTVLVAFCGLIGDRFHALELGLIVGLAFLLFSFFTGRSGEVD